MKIRFLIPSAVALAALAIVLMFSQGTGSAQEPQPDLLMAKAADSAAVAPGDFVAYTVRFTNTTALTVELSSLVDTLPDDFEYVSLAPGSDWEEEPSERTGPEIEWAGPITVPASGDLTVRYWIHVPGDVPLSAAPYINTAEATRNGSSYQAEAGLLVAVGHVSVNKTASDTTVAPGSVVTYSVAFSNSGYVEMPLAVVTDVLPAGVTFIGVTPGSDVQDAPVDVSGALTWTGPYTLASHGQLLVQYATRMPEVDESASLVNRAGGRLVDGSGVGPASQEVIVSPGGPMTITLPIIYRHWAPARFEVAKSADRTQAYAQTPGDLITYTVKIDNIGTDSGTLADVRDTLPTGFTFSGMALGSDVSTDPVGTSGQIVWNGPFDVDGQSSLTLIYQVRASSSTGTYTNVATATASKGISPQAPGTATVELIEPNLLVESWENPSQYWEPFLNYWRLKPEQWYIEWGAGVNGSAALKQTYFYGVVDPNDGAHDALYIYQGPGSGAWTNYRYECMTIMNLGYTQGLWFRANYTHSELSGRHIEGYFLNWRPGENLVKLMTVREYEPYSYHFSTLEELARATYTLRKGVWYQVVVEVRGNNIKAYIDGNLVIDVDDDKFPTGSVGFYAYKVANAAWDNIVVSQLP